MSGASDTVGDGVRALRAGRLVAFPTETVYGLGADATNRSALRRLFELKGRPPSHPVIVHLAAGDLDEVLTPWVRFVPPAARALGEACWPGPLTLVLPRAPAVPDEVTGGRDSVGVRVPDQRLAQQLLSAFGGGVAAPSANRFGRVSPTTAAHVQADLNGDVDVILDGGPTRVGLESTIVDCSSDEPVVLRLGGVPSETLAAVLGVAPPLCTDGRRSAPGTMASHYAPAVPVVLVEAAEVRPRAAALLAAGRRVGLLAAAATPDVPAALEVLPAPRAPDALARRLYSLLRDADRRGLDVLLVVPPSGGGLAAAVRDRLQRAAGAGASP